MTKTNWYVVYTKPRCELKVANLLTGKHIKNYCPLHFLQNRFVTTRKPVHQPLFTSCVFVCIHDYELNSVLQTPGIISYLYWLNKPAIITNEEMESMVVLLKEYSYVRLEKCIIYQNEDQKIGDCRCLSPESSSNPNQVTLILPSLGYCIIASASQEPAREEQNN